MAYKKEQWIASFEDQLSILRPHLTGRPLASMSLAPGINTARRTKTRSRRRETCPSRWINRRSRRVRRSSQEGRQPGDHANRSSI